MSSLKFKKNALLSLKFLASMLVRFLSTYSISLSDRIFVSCSVRNPVDTADHHEKLTFATAYISFVKKLFVRFLIHSCVPDPMFPLVHIIMLLLSRSIAVIFIVVCHGFSAVPDGMVNALSALKKSQSSVMNLVFAIRLNSSCVGLYIVIVPTDGFCMCLMLFALIVSS
jgi:hypothetical protein